MKVCVLGLGEVGLPTALHAKNSNLEVWGYDTSATAIKQAEEMGIRATSVWRGSPSAEIYLVCVSTGLRDLNPDMSQVYDVCCKIVRKEKPLLVSIESTVCPGTCSKIHSEIFDSDIHLVHVPHRYWALDPVHHGVKQMRVIGGTDSESLDIGVRFYKEKLGIPLHIASSIEVAEMSKIAENAYRYVEIAFAEELRMISEELGLKFEEVKEACNTKWNVQILEARDGIKGHCLLKDTTYVLSLTEYNKLLRGAIHADQVYRAWLSKRREPTS